MGLFLVFSVMPKREREKPLWALGVGASGFRSKKRRPASGPDDRMGPICSAHRQGAAGKAVPSCMRGRFPTAVKRFSFSGLYGRAGMHPRRFSSVFPNAVSTAASGVSAGISAAGFAAAAAALSAAVAASVAAAVFTAAATGISAASTVVTAWVGGRGSVVAAVVTSAGIRLRPGIG